jgi:outer membrane protein assembly factor BamB
MNSINRKIFIRARPYATLPYAILHCAWLLFAALPLAAQQNKNSGSGKIDPAGAPVSAAPLWNLDIGDTVTATPIMQASSTVLLGSGGSVKSYFMTGTALWNFDPRDKVTPYIARSREGISYVCNSAGSFMAINRIGRELWRRDLGQPVSFPPVIGWDGRIFIPVGSKIICRTASGWQLWSLDLGSPIASAPVLDHAGALVTVLQNQTFVRITQFSAVERIQLNRKPDIIVPLQNGNRHSYVLFQSLGETAEIAYNENAAQGSKLSVSRFIQLPAVPAAAAGRGNIFAAALRDGRVICADGSGKVLWTLNSHETTAEKGAGNLTSERAGIVFDERGIYCITTTGVTGFAENGRRRFVLKYEMETSGVPGISDEGLLYACGKDNKLRLYKLDSKPRTVPRSKYYGPDPEGSYGMGNPPPSMWSSDSRRYENTQQEAMLAMLDREISAGQLGENEPQYVAYMMEMIGFFLNDPHYSSFRPAVNPIMQVKLIKLLGRIGSRETVPFLWNIFDNIKEPSVRSACAEAIGTIGIDPDVRTFKSYSFLLSPNNPNRDPQLLISAASSIAALCRYVGPPLAADGIYLLRALSMLNYAPQPVKDHIKAELDALGREGLDKVLQ